MTRLVMWFGKLTIQSGVWIAKCPVYHCVSISGVLIRGVLIRGVLIRGVLIRKAPD